MTEFAAMAYPVTDADKAICAAALAVVEQSGGLSSMEHLDALLLATHPDWCKAFLDKRGQAAFDAACKSAPPALFVGQGQSIRWKDCRDHLERLGAIVVDRSTRDQPISKGIALAASKAAFPTGVDEVVKFALYIDEARKRGRVSTPPTYFRTLTEMAHSIVHEQERTDHPAAEEISRHE